MDWSAESHKNNVVDCLRKAKRLTPAEYSDPVFWEDCPLIGYADGYFDNAGEAVEAAEGDGHEHPPAWLWAATSHSIEIDAGGVIDEAMYRLHDDAEVPTPAKDDLARYLAAWCKRQDVVEGTLTWEEDRTRVIVLDQARLNAEIASGGHDS